MWLQGPEITVYGQFTDLHDNLIRGVIEWERKYLKSKQEL